MSKGKIADLTAKPTFKNINKAIQIFVHPSVELVYNNMGPNGASYYYFATRIGAKSTHWLGDNWRDSIYEVSLGDYTLKKWVALAACWCAESLAREFSFIERKTGESIKLGEGLSLDDVDVLTNRQEEMRVETHDERLEFEKFLLKENAGKQFFYAIKKDGAGWIFDVVYLGKRKSTAIQKFKRLHFYYGSKSSKKSMYLIGVSKGGAKSVIETKFKK